MFASWTVASKYEISEDGFVQPVATATQSPWDFSPRREEAVLSDALLVAACRGVAEQQAAALAFVSRWGLLGDLVECAIAIEHPTAEPLIEVRTEAGWRCDHLAHRTEGRVLNSAGGNIRSVSYEQYGWFFVTPPPHDYPRVVGGPAFWASYRESVNGIIDQLVVLAGAIGPKRLPAHVGACPPAASLVWTRRRLTVVYSSLLSFMFHSGMGLQTRSRIKRCKASDCDSLFIVDAGRGSRREYCPGRCKGRENTKNWLESPKGRAAKKKRSAQAKTRRGRVRRRAGSETGAAEQ